MLENWVVTPTCLPLVIRRCHACASERFRANGKFRVNANHKVIDAWLLVLCTACGDTAKLTVLERVHVRSVRPELLDRLHDNDLGLTAELLQAPVVMRRNRIALDWDNAWRLDTGGPDHADRQALRRLHLHTEALSPPREQRGLSGEIRRTGLSFRLCTQQQSRTFPGFTS